MVLRGAGKWCGWCFAAPDGSVSVWGKGCVNWCLVIPGGVGEWREGRGWEGIALRRDRDM